MQSGIAQRRQIEGWGFSIILHGLLLSAIWPVFHYLPAQIHPEPFQWNVIFVESPQQTTPVEPDSDAPFTKEFLRTGEAKVRSAVSLPPNVPRPPDQAKKDTYRIAEESGDTRPLSAASPPTLMAQPKPEVSPQMSPSTQTTPITQEAPPVEQPKTSMTATPLSSELPAQPVASIEQELPSTPASPVADAGTASDQSRDIPPVSSPPAPPAASGQPSAPQTDYSWLQRAVSRRLEELKRSSRPSLEDSSRLKVLVKAVVSSTGELMEAEVVKSSGLDRIDQEAMTLVQRAFPLPLDHTLDRQQIVMRIPITYSRD
jgi:protein TonB